MTMKVTRIAVGILILSLVAVSVVRAQQATAQARQEQDAARALAERSLQEAADARAAAEAEMQMVMQQHLEKALAQTEEEASRARGVAELLGEALARRGNLEALKSPELRHSLEEIAQMTRGMQDPSSQFGRIIQDLRRGDGSSHRLEERVRALEERLGMTRVEPGRSLEDRVAELERRTMGGEERSARIPGESAGPRGPGLPGGPRPGLPRQPLPGAESPDAPEPPVTPEPGVRWRRESAGPSAPRHPPGPGLTPERRREIEEVMRRMRNEMERLREEMNRLRDELGRNGDLQKLRGLGYTGRSEEPRRR